MDLLFLLAFPLLLALSTSCDACVCKLPHPQTTYCESDVVMLTDLLGLGPVIRNKQSLRVNVTKIFKGPLKANEIHEIYTPHSFEDCGFLMQTSIRTNILIAGFLTAGKIHFTTCHLVYIWAHLFLEQRLGLESFYRKGCDCHINPCLSCLDSCPEPDEKECVWQQKDCQYSYWEGDQTKTSMCFASKTGRCQWFTIPTSGTSLVPR
ncbi:metalloproteinase inhibitor 1-like [Sciurus carolinensis]|uniref:metalloproteinase inhibitor 1-like n=1 Tax=Sciurus carolinensis TaxID=30640 RepID=UPI001FB32FD7|nr:metalloproteinase inhibitor 1-like [Sciurus carolinensis]